MRASDAKDRQKWTDKLRQCSGSNSAQVFVSSLSPPKPVANQASLPLPSSMDPHSRSPQQRDSKIYHHQQTLKEMREVLRCVEVNQRDFVDTIDVIPDTLPVHPLSKDMLLLRSISFSCLNSLQDTLMILTRRRTPDTEALPIVVPATSSSQSTAPWPNLAGKQLSQSYNSSSSAKSSLTIEMPSQTSSRAPLNKTASLGGLDQSSSYHDTALSIRALQTDRDSLTPTTQPSS